MAFDGFESAKRFEERKFSHLGNQRVHRWIQPRMEKVSKESETPCQKTSQREKKQKKKGKEMKLLQVPLSPSLSFSLPISLTVELFVTSISNL